MQEKEAPKINSAIRMPSKLDYTFFRVWIEFMRPFHHLTEREMEVVASFIKQRYELSKMITDTQLLDKVLMSEDTKRKVRNECGISLQHFQVIMGKLKKRKVIENGKIKDKFIPKIPSDEKSFKFLLIFDFS